ncbi:MAG: hypothetical protein GF411_00095 [Candidatus Lokiarchaeota archaeon]|nr:hypothetical protein [Candidatus Lokiarchaeota archaeon]
MGNSNMEPLMGGIYIFSFSSQWKAEAFIERFKDCPNWPVIEKSDTPNQVVVTAIESVHQKHGDFTTAHNTLVENPELIGAKSVSFLRDDRLVFLFSENPYDSKLQETSPCGSDCEKCPRFTNPCRGCPAVHR